MGLAVRKPEDMVALMPTAFCLLGFPLLACLFVDMPDFGLRLRELQLGLELLLALLECLPELSFWVLAFLSGHLSA